MFIQKCHIFIQLWRTQRDLELKCQFIEIKPWKFLIHKSTRVWDNTMQLRALKLQMGERRKLWGKSHPCKVLEDLRCNGLCWCQLLNSSDLLTCHPVHVLESKAMKTCGHDISWLSYIWRAESRGLKPPQQFLLYLLASPRTPYQHICPGLWGLSQQPEIKIEHVCTLALHLFLRPGVSFLQQLLERWALWGLEYFWFIILRSFHVGKCRAQEPFFVMSY